MSQRWYGLIHIHKQITVWEDKTTDAISFFFFFALYSDPQHQNITVKQLS